MLKERLPVTIDPFRMAEAARILEGRYPLTQMERLRDSLLESSGEVQVSLEFGRDNEGIRYMKGTMRTEVTLECQRCLQPLRTTIDTGFKLGLVRNTAQAEQLPSYYEPLLVEEESLFLRDIVEDELLLALPLVPMHDNEQCHEENLPKGGKGKREQDTGESGKGDNPFAVLAALKTDGNR